MTTRDKLLAATADALRRDGIAGLSARSIATRANVNQALVFYHFGTMSELVQEATRKSVDDSVAYYRPHLAAAGSLLDLLAVGRDLHERERDAGKVWETLVIGYVGHRDEHTIELAKQLDRLKRRGVDAEQVLDLAAARKSLPTDHATAALAYRVRELVTPKSTRRTVQCAEPFERSQQPSGPSLGM